jgi:hypothetical protein
VFSSTQVSSLSQNSHINPQRVPNRVTRWVCKNFAQNVHTHTFNVGLYAQRWEKVALKTASEVVILEKNAQSKQSPNGDGHPGPQQDRSSYVKVRL